MTYPQTRPASGPESAVALLSVIPQRSIEFFPGSDQGLVANKDS
jgi:hypothetical protein